MRILGVHGQNNPVKKALTVQPADFLVGAIVGKFERAFDKAFYGRSPQEIRDIFGDQISATYYGWDAVNGFFANAVGVSSKLYISSHVGYTGSAVDGVTASQEINDQESPTPAPILKIEDAYQTELGYGVSGNRTGITLVPGNRFTTACNGAGGTTDLFVVVDSVADVFVGDIITFTPTGGSAQYRIVTTVDEATKKIGFAGAVGTPAVADNDAVSVLGFKLHVWRKNTAGIVSEVDTDLGSQWCTTETAVTKYFVGNIFASSKWIKVSRIATPAGAAATLMPAAISTVTYPTNGADGTAPTTAAHWGRALTRLDAMPVRMIALVESSLATIQASVETYCKSRTDTPIAVVHVASNQTKTQLITAGNGFQRGDDVMMLPVGHWGSVTDPFNTASNAPYRAVPATGHIMGAWVRAIGNLGIHVIPAVREIPLYGLADVYGTQFPASADRTDIATAGMNCLENVSGAGIMLRNAFTPSTDVAYQFVNGLIMRNYIKVSAEDSLQTSENTPNSLNRVKADRMAILTFLYKLWDTGSTGHVAKGETFGQTFNADGTPTKPEQHFEVIADITNNPKSSLDAGERNIDVSFTRPSPAGSIRIGVGILLLS